MKAIMAVDDYKLEEKIKKENNIETVFINLQYREAVLEILEKNENIDLIYISEKIPGEISIEKLMKKIKLINKKINIIFILEKEDENKEKELRKIGINKIYIKNKSNLNKEINNKIKNKINLNKKSNNKIKNKNNNLKNKKIITIEGKIKTGKSTVTNLLFKYLIEKNKKVFIIHLNKNNQKKYFNFLEEKYFDKSEEEKKLYKNFFINYLKKYEYILIDIGNNCNSTLKRNLTQNSDKNFIIIDQTLLGIKGMKDILKEKKNGLHIIYNKYRYIGISKDIIINFFEENPKIYKIYYNKNYKNLGKQNEKTKNIKIDRKSKKEIKKIFI